MLRKMLFQGLLAAAVIAGGAALYAVTTTAQPAQVANTAEANTGPAGQAGNGYLPMDRDRASAGKHDRHKRDDAGEYRKHRDGEHAHRKHKRDHDDD